MTSEISVGKILQKKKKTLAVAESCTGGLICSRITNIGGSSEYFIAGIVAYSDGIKQNVLGVSAESLQKYGAVSRQAALEMAKGVRFLSGADIGLGITGIAGPSGGTKTKPVGLVYIAFVSKKKQLAKKFLFKGSRKDIKSRASQKALDLICAHS